MRTTCPPDPGMEQKTRWAQFVLRGHPDRSIGLAERSDEGADAREGRLDRLERNLIAVVNVEVSQAHVDFGTRRCRAALRGRGCLVEIGGVRGVCWPAGTGDDHDEAGDVASLQGDGLPARDEVMISCCWRRSNSGQSCTVRCSCRGCARLGPSRTSSAPWSTTTLRSGLRAILRTRRLCRRTLGVATRVECRSCWCRS